MEEKTNTDLGLTARAWEAAKIYSGSNMLKHFDGIVHTESVETLGNFTKKRGIETSGVDIEAKTDDLLLKYTVTKITPERHLDEVENPTEMYLITDQYGHDIGTYEITENGPVFKLSPKIQENNEKIISTFPEEQQAILREKYRTDNVEELISKLAKGEEIALASKEQARDDIEKEYEERGLSEPDGTTNEDPEEEKAISAIPSDMRAEVIKQCREKGISIKEVLIVDCPTCLTEEIDNEKVGIRKDGGPVILVQARSGDASLSDDVYAFQDGVEILNANAQKERLVNLMEQHHGEGAVVELEDTEKERVIDHIAEVIEVNEYKIAQLESAHFESEEDREDAIMKVRNDLVGEVKSVIDYHDYEPDEQIKDVVADLEYQAAPDSMDTLDDIQAGINEGIAGAASAALGIDDEPEKNRWDSANPYNHY